MVGALGGLPEGLRCRTPGRTAGIGGLGCDGQCLRAHQAARGAAARPGTFLGLPPKLVEQRGALGLQARLCW